MIDGLYARSLRIYQNVLPRHSHIKFAQAVFLRSQQPQTRSNTWKKPGAHVKLKYDTGVWSSIPKKNPPISLVNFRRTPIQKKVPNAYSVSALKKVQGTSTWIVNMSRKHSLNNAGEIAHLRERKKKRGEKLTQINGRPWADASNDDILRIEVQDLLQSIERNDALAVHVVAQREEQQTQSRSDEVAPEQTEEPLNQNIELSATKRLGQQVEGQEQRPFALKIVKTSSTGDGLALDLQNEQVYVIPFAIEGDTVLAKPYGTPNIEHLRRADFIKVINPSPLRDDSRIRCKYFAACGGCQLQMMSQEDQLAHKKKIVQRAYAAFSNMNPDLIPVVEDTLASPLQYEYRTKLTPHFDGPVGMKRRGRKYWQPKPQHESMPKIGFNLKNQRKVLDIEECPIGTKAVNHGLVRERERIEREYGKYTKGATILLRETTDRVGKKSEIALSSFDAAEVTETDKYYEIKNCVTANNDSVQEYVKDILFVNNANSFFQNNNSILSPFLDYIKDCLFPQADSAPKGASDHFKKPKYLVDAYCGSGLFTVSLAKYFEKSIGVDIDPNGIHYASLNAQRNGISNRKARFKTSNAAEIFNNIEFPPDETVMIIDPPRKGCDLRFLHQLLLFGPERIVYVSCNVHTQARDVGFLSHGLVSNDEESMEHLSYELQSLRGCDFFPQTAHVEAVAILRKKRDSNSHVSAPATDLLPSVPNDTAESSTRV